MDLGGAQILVFDIMKFLLTKDNTDITLITIDGGEYIDIFRKGGIRVIDLQMKGLINIKIYFKLKNILKKLNPDIVHTHLHKADFYGRLAAKSCNTKLIYSTCHNYSSHHKGADINKISIFDRIDNYVISYTRSNMIAISEVVHKYLVNRNSKYENITEVIYNGVNIEKEKYKLNENDIINLRKRYNISKSDFVIAILGRLEKQKGHIFFLESIKDYIREKRNIKVLILGEGNLRSEIERIIKENDMTEHVSVLGFIKDTEKYIEISDLICVPSLWEGFGLVIIEGMIKKKIVLASNAGGIPEIIEDCKTGYLFEVQNKNSLLEKLNFIYENYKNLDLIRENALKSVKQKFDIQKNSELYYLSYKKKIKICLNK